MIKTARILSLLWIALCWLGAPLTAQASWFDSAWPYRRLIQVKLSDAFEGHQLYTCEFYTDGHALPNGDDIRVTTQDGQLVPSHVLMAGPGDRMRVVFQPRKDIEDYAVYFGNPHPQPPPGESHELQYVGGLMMETRQWTGGAVNSFASIERSWNRSKPVLGQIMIDSPFIGYNAFGDQDQWISKMTGMLLAPVEGDYTLAMAVDDEGGFFIDGKPTLFAHLGPGDIRYHTKIHLDKGWHDFLLYHVNFAGEGYVSVGWLRPLTEHVEVIDRQFFGSSVPVDAGPLEEHGKTLIADFSCTQVGECFVTDSYVFRYHFSPKTKPGLAVKAQWDFGDGQTSASASPDHVYLSSGIYTVKMTARSGSNQDVQSNRLVVGRDYAKILDARELPSAGLSDVVARYELGLIPTDSLPRAIMLHLKAGHLDDAVAAANKLAAAPSHSDVAASFNVLWMLEKKLINADRPDTAVAMWDFVPLDSRLQPRAAQHEAELALWWMGDFEKAAAILRPFQDKGDDAIHRMYAQSLVLSGKVDDGKRILNSIASPIPAARRAALSGAAARSVEYFITEKESDAGEEAWDRWMTRFPTEYLEGYSVVLRTRLIELRNRPLAGAKVAEAFAMAEPQSSYAPQLLDRASKLLSNSDPTKSRALRDLLKQKYPENPLSQSP